MIKHVRLSQHCGCSWPGALAPGHQWLQYCQRTKDAWLRSVQKEFPHGELAEETHAFLHGQHTMNPGSTVNGIAKKKKKMHCACNCSS